jgi:hypothetical protein
MGNDILVAIWMVTYNHGDFIQKAIESVMMQKCTFSYKLYIGEDNSSDNTREVCKSLKDKYPNKIELFLHENNLGANANGDFMYLQCFNSGSKYIALCEGDDYWIDPFKLQKQVDFLEKNLEYGLVHHEADYFFQKSGFLIKSHHNANSIFPSNGFIFNELLISNYIYTPTVMFRSSLLKYLTIDIRNNFLFGDYAMWLEFAHHCKMYYFPDSMAVYRVLDNSSSRSIFYEKNIAFVDSYFNIKTFFLNKYNSNIITHFDIEQERLSSRLSIAIKHKKYKDARIFASKLKLNNWRLFLKRILVFTPILFRYIQKKNKL